MKTQIFSKRHFRWLNLPTLSLVAFLQRTPVAQVAATAEEFVLASPIGNLLKGVAGTVASLGAMNSLVGATPLVPSTGEASGITVTAGTAVTVAYTVTPTDTPIMSWNIGGMIPPGLNFSGKTAAGGVNVESLLLSGTPTTAGAFTVTLQAFQFQNESGIPSVVYSYTITVKGGVAVAPAIATQPQSQSAAVGGNISLSAAATGTPAPTFQWKHNGVDVDGATGATLALNNVQPANTGVYTVTAANSAGSVTSNPAIVGVTTTSLVIGTGTVVGTNLPHPNGNHFDQVLVTGAAEAITADFAENRITRTSYIDLNDDIVQVEFAGPGTLSLVLDNASAPAAPAKYNQPTVAYAKGHATIVIAGADERTNLSVFTVGRATAFDPTGTYDILVSPGGANDPAKNGSSLFAGQAATTYDGVGDIALVAILSTNGKFGGVRMADADCFASVGLTGVYAPNVAFQGPLRIEDVDAFDSATPMIVLGSVSDSLITGGDLKQDNHQPVQVNGLVQLKFTAGQDSGGNTLAAKANLAALHNSSGQDVTAQIVVNP